MDPNLLSMLLGMTGGQQDPNQAPAPSPVSAPSPLQPQAVPQQASPSEANPITVTGQGDAWRPHKRNLLGTVADFALAALGIPLFPFGKHNENRNIHEAMLGYGANPHQAIHRLAQVGGQEFKSQELADQADDSDMKAANYKRMNDVLEFQKQKQSEGIAANMMYSASQASDPASAWEAMKQQVRKRDEVNGTSVADEIPDNPDLSSIDILAGSNIPAWRQAALLEQYRNHDLQHEDRQANTGETSRHHRVTEGQGEERVGISATNAKTGQYNADTSRKSEEKRPNQVPGEKGMVKMKNGMQLPYEDQPDGSRVVYAPDGTAYRYVKVNGTFVPTHQKIPPKQASQSE